MNFVDIVNILGIISAVVAAVFSGYIYTKYLRKS